MRVYKARVEVKGAQKGLFTAREVPLVIDLVHADGQVRLGKIGIVFERALCCFFRPRICAGGRERAVTELCVTDREACISQRASGIVFDRLRE